MEEYNFSQEKPELVENDSKSGLSLTFFSMALFVLAFTLVFGDELSFILFILVVLLVHELGHFLTMKLFKYERVRMLFIPLMGAFVQGSKKVYSQKQSFIVTAAGPFPGVLVGTVLMYYGVKLHSVWMMELSGLFLMLNIINLLPLDPLDGGQLFKLFLRKSHAFFLLIFAFISSILMIGLGWMMDSTVVIVFGFLMGVRVRAMQRRYQVHQELKSLGVEYVRSYASLSYRDFIAIKTSLMERTSSLRKYIEQASEPESSSVIASQVNNVLEVPIQHDASIIFKLMILLFWIASFAAPIFLFFYLDPSSQDLQWYFDAI